MSSDVFLQVVQVENRDTALGSGGAIELIQDEQMLAELTWWEGEDGKIEGNLTYVAPNSRFKVSRVRRPSWTGRQEN